MLTVYPADFAPTDSILAGAIGSLPFALNAECSQKINGDWCLKFSYPCSRPGAELLNVDALVLCQGQLYRIARVITNDTAGKQEYDIEAPHIAFDLANYCIENIETDADDETLDGIDAYTAMTQVLDGTPFSVGVVDVDLSHMDYLDILQQSVMDALKQIVDLWGGELVYDNFTVHLRTRCGALRNYPIRQGRNLTSLKYTEDLSKVVTRLHIIGYGGMDIKEVNDGKDYLDSQYINNYSHIFEGYVTFDDEDLPDVLKTMGQEYLATVEVPAITFDVGLANLKGSPQYKFYAGLETYELGDTAILHHDALRADFTLRCQERTFYPVTGINKSVKLGNADDDLGVSLSAALTASEAVKNIMGKHNTVKASRLQGTIDAMKTLLYASAQYQEAQVQEDHGILFEDNDPESTTYGAMYIGPGVFAIANDKDESNAWNWKTFGSGQGFSAEMITTGVLDAERVDVRNMDLNINTVFQIALGELDSRIQNADGAYTELNQSFEKLEATVGDHNEVLAHMSFDEKGLHIDKDNDDAVFNADNRTLGVTNVKTERLGIAQTMDQDAEWAWMATRSGLGLKYIGPEVT